MRLENGIRAKQEEDKQHVQRLSEEILRLRGECEAKGGQSKDLEDLVKENGKELEEVRR